MAGYDMQSLPLLTQTHTAAQQKTAYQKGDDGHLVLGKVMERAGLQIRQNRNRNSNDGRPIKAFL